MKLIQSPSPQANNIVSAQGLTLTSLCFLHTLSMSTTWKIADVGNWKEIDGQVQINIEASGKEIELIIAESKLNFECMKPLKLIIPKQQKSSSPTPGGEKKIADVGDWTEEPGRVKINITAAGEGIELNIDEAMKLKFKYPFQIIIPKQQAAEKGQGSSEQGSSGQKEVEKSKEGSSKQNTKSQEPKRDENMLENVMSKLTIYKGIVITAFIAISLGFLLRRKFKAAGN